MCENPYEGDVKVLRGRNSLRRRVGDWRVLFDLDQGNRLLFYISVVFSLYPLAEPRAERRAERHARSGAGW